MVDAMKIFKTLQGAKLRPDVVSYTALIQGFGKQRSFNKVSEIFSEIQRSRFCSYINLHVVES